ncbi:MAG TPA: hypothetical protein VKB84_12925 [Candidatus Binataceae bacterium]|nr:hypothetical protein [Candidatus Binataceae bacterium]
MMNLSNQTVLVIDQGLYVHIAEKLAESFGRVLYYCNGWRSAFPVSERFNVGAGIDGIERIANPWEHVEGADLIVFPDTYFGGEQEYLRRQGKRVWGSGHAEILELHRDELKTLMKSAGLAVGRYEIITGIEPLRQYLKDNPGVYVKGNVFRGDVETFRNKNWVVTQPLLDDLASRLGPRQSSVVFVVEDPIEGVEAGYDGVCVDGRFPAVGSFGYKAKDAGYVGKVVDYEDLPQALREVNTRLAPAMAALGCRSFYSTEVRVGVDRKAYLMDPAMRAGSPPSEAYIELFANWDEVIWAGADGEVVDLRPAAGYAAEIILRSEWAREHFLALEIPAAARGFVKIHGHCRIEGRDYAAPLGIREFGAAVGLGNSLEDAVGAALEHAEAVEGLEVEFDRNALDAAMEAVERGREFGIDW